MPRIQAFSLAVIVALTTAWALWRWTHDIREQVIETALIAMQGPVEVDDMMTAKWLWDDPETPAVDPIEIELTKGEATTLAEFRQQVREAKIAFPPYTPPEGN